VSRGAACRLDAVPVQGAGEAQGQASAIPRTRRWSFHRMPPGIRLCVALVAILTIAALFAPWLAPHDPDATAILARLKPPYFMGGHDAAYPFGTDALGRDLLSRCMYGIRVSVGVALLGLAIGCAIGTAFGILSGLCGGIVDRAIMMLVDVFITVPFLLLVLVGIAVFGTDTAVLVALIGLARWESYARIVRGQVLQLREMPYIEASRALGASRTWIAIRHVLPLLPGHRRAAADGLARAHGGRRT